MDEDVYRSFKSICDSVGLPEYVVLLRCFLFANKLATERATAIITDDNKNVLTFNDVIQVIVQNNAHAREVFHEIDSWTTWMRKAGIVVTAVANGSVEDFPVLRRSARKLAQDTPWADPKGGV
jgi:hypothetical protein